MRAKANSLPGSAAVTTGLLLQFGPRLAVLIALKRAPTAGPVAPSSQVQQCDPEYLRGEDPGVGRNAQRTPDYRPSQRLRAAERSLQPEAAELKYQDERRPFVETDGVLLVVCLQNSRAVRG